MAEVSTELVWRVVAAQPFAVVGLVTARGEPRTVGVVPFVRERTVWWAAHEHDWKVRHVRANPAVSVTVPIPKRVPFFPWAKIPAATVTFQATATVLPAGEGDPQVVHALTRGLSGDDGTRGPLVLVSMVPHGEFVTYGVGVSLMTMRDTEKARGRVAVS